MSRTGASLFRAACLLLAAAPAWAAGDLCLHGRQQSPISIMTAQPRAMPTLQFQYRASPVRIVNDNLAVQVQFNAAGQLRWGDAAFKLMRLSFHRTSGHRVGGEEFPLAVHLHHRSAQGKTLVLVALFRIGPEHAAFGELVPHIPLPGAAVALATDVPVDPARWLPATSGYYTYEGSLLSAPCTEGVQWVILKQPQTVSVAQFDALAARMVPNARGLQPLNDRTVWDSGAPSP